MDNKKTEVKREHYVPESYLNRFANENGKICVYDYNKAELRRDQSTDKIAKIKGFYDFDKEELEKLQKINVEIDKQYIEKMFAQKIEPALNDIIDKLSNLDPDFCTDCPSIKNKNLKLSLSYLLVFQLLRTRAYREFFIEFLGSKKAGKMQHNFTLINQEVIENLAQYICNMSWNIFYNAGTKPYITSDNPVVVCDYDFNYGHKALESDRKKTLMYPLTPRILIFILSTEYTGIADDSTIDICLNDVKNDEMVDFPNSQQMENAYQYVFTSYDFPEKYFIDKQAGYQPIPFSADGLKYEDEINTLITHIPYLEKLIRKLGDPDCTEEMALKIGKETEKIFEGVNQMREKLGMEKWDILNGLDLKDFL